MAAPVNGARRPELKRTPRPPHELDAAAQAVQQATTPAALALPLNQLPFLAQADGGTFPPQAPGGPRLFMLVMRLQTSLAGGRELGLSIPIGCQARQAAGHLRELAARLDELDQAAQRAKLEAASAGLIELPAAELKLPAAQEEPGGEEEPKAKH